MRDEEDVDGGGVHQVDEGQRVQPGEARVDAAVQQDGLVFELQHVAGAAHLLAGTQRPRMRIN